MTLAPDELVEVHLIGIPLPIWAQAQEHVDELLREFTLLVAGVQQHQSETNVPRRLLSLVDELQRDYEGITADQGAQLAQAAAAGLESLDLTYRVPRSTADACVALGHALDAADQFCRAGEHLLTLATPPEALAFRRWYLGEFVRQIAGQPPTPWPERARTR